MGLAALSFPPCYITATHSMTAFSDKPETIVQSFNHFLDSQLTAADVPEELLSAMRYSALAGGKRIRPLMVYALGEVFDAPKERLNVVAAAVELIHCYSLIHDDLPAMDNDDLRRGKPTLHIAYDEAMAILAGDALLTLAFELISRNVSLWPSADAPLKAISLLASSSGAAGMVGGQVLDIRAEGAQPTRQEVERMFLMKTGALIRVSAELGLCCCGNAVDNDWDAITKYGNAIGQAFQIQDDILDVIASSETLGKPQGSDEEKDKPNYALTFGLEFAQQRAKELYEQALEAIKPYGDNADALRWLANYIIYRKH